MTELERALLLVGNDVDVPPTPMGISGIVRERIATWRRRRRTALVAVAAALAGIAVAFAVPGARSAILRFFHIGAVKVERVNTLPHATHASPTAGLGKPLARADAEREAGFHARLGSTTARGPWYAREKLLATELHADVLLIEIAGEQAWLVKKLANGDVFPADVHGAFALWIPGRHVLVYDRGGGNIGRIARYSGTALVWARGGLTYRLEGEETEHDALADARKITP